jgi:hypothetical protein
MDECKKRTEEAAAIWKNRVADNTGLVLLLPDGDARLNALFRSAFTAKLGARAGLVIEGRDAEALLDLYSLYEFTDKLIIASFDEPCGRKLRNLIESGVASEEELIGDVILGDV